MRICVASVALTTSLGLSLDRVPPPVANDIDFDAEDAADQFVANLKTELPDDLFVIVQGVLAGHTHRDLAESLGIDERTVRRRLSRVRKLLDPSATTTGDRVDTAIRSPSLPRVNYNEFVLGKWIGSGGFGKVYRAIMQCDGRTVAVKFLRKAFWQSDGVRESFLREVNTASQITHPGVIRYLGYGESPHGGPYIISEWINGHSLQDVRVVTPLQITGLLRQVCEAITCVHQAGLVHGDLSPSNVLVDAEGRITVTDFGFSQRAIRSARGKRPAHRNRPAHPNKPAQPVLTGSTILGGTLGFAAPEQIDPAFGSIGPKTDVYAIGGLLHWLLLGQPPNAGQSAQQILSATLSPTEANATDFDNLPKPFGRILTQTLCHSPADRHLTLDDIIRALAAAENDV